jgi:group I intron endonuclease
VSSRVCGVYVIQNTVNGKVYVGSSNDVKARLRQHRYDLSVNKHGNSHLQASWHKYGKKAFVYEIEEICDEKDLLLIEECFIEFYMSWNNRVGYNFIRRPTRPVMNEETLRKISRALKGQKRGPCSPERAANISAAKKGKKFSDAHKAALSRASAWKGKPVSPETKAKISESLKGKMAGEKNPMYGRCGALNPSYGKPKSEETKQKIRDARQGKCCGEEHANAKLTWDFVYEIRQRYAESDQHRGIQAELAREYDLSQTTIGKVIANKVWKNES